MSDKEEIKKIIEEFINNTNFDININSLDIEENTVHVNLDTSEPKVLIGKNGQNLSDIQHILNIIMKKRTHEDLFMDVDINSYKRSKREYLQELAIDMADEVVLNGKEKILEPMTAYERKIIHLVLSKRKDVITESIGQEPDRRIIIKVAP
jgi:spoIIIJ-associated protein